MFDDHNNNQSHRPFTAESFKSENENDNESSLDDDNYLYKVSSYRDENYQSEAMKHILTITQHEVVDPKLYDPYNNSSYSTAAHPIKKVETMKPTKALYKTNDSLPQWLLEREEWQIVKSLKTVNEISEILKLSYSERKPDQNMLLVNWLMSVWPIAGKLFVFSIS